MNKTLITSTCILSLSLALSGCGTNASGTADSSTATPVAVGAAITADNSSTGMKVDIALVSECANGGSVIRLYKDANGNGAYDLGEAIISSTPICNGATGATGATGVQGYGTGISVMAAAAGACSAGGSVLTTFQDKNNNSVLDNGESITSTSTICNGAKGATGATGAAGASASLTTSIASSSQCANGGYVYTSHVDGQAASVNVVCNGAQGATGATGATSASAVVLSGSIGSVVKGTALTACRHDYLFVPGSSGSTHGWLIFRHQLNGSADSGGSGTQGFNVWNVDISDFYLVSEDLKVNYCKMHWEPSTKLLTYSVISTTDGKLGESGKIQIGK